MIQVFVREGVDFAELGRRWSDLESRSACSFFLSWTWTGCLIEERFPNPVLVEAIDDGRTVALALFNRTRRWGVPVLWLHESGDPALDCPWIEQNGVLTEAGRGHILRGVGPRGPPPPPLGPPGSRQPCRLSPFSSSVEHPHRSPRNVSWNVLT